MSDVDLDSSPSSVASNVNGDTQVSTGSFYGKKYEDSIRDKWNLPHVKVTRLPTSVLEHYLQKSPNNSSDEHESKVPKARKKPLPVLGTQATRHSIKPSSSKKRKHRRHSKDFKKIEVMDLEGNSASEQNGDDSEFTRNARRNPRRKATTIVREKRSPSASSEEYMQGVRRNPSRRAATEGYEKMSKAYDGMEDSESTSDTSSGSSYSSDEELKVKKSLNKKNTNPVPKPEFSEYEKAAQEKVALRKEFLKSLNMLSFHN